MPNFNQLRIPQNIIAVWTGTIASIPPGWLLCDGTSGTPDLRSRFIKSVDDSCTNPGTTGGADTHQLTSAQIASHSHTLSCTSHIHSLAASNQTSDSTTPGSQAGTSVALCSPATTNSGSDTAHENRPAFYEVAYIMKENV